MSQQKNILICPLDWGLGHAARCVPIINELLRLNFNVIIGADKNPLAFLQQEFPELKTVVIPGYEVAYDEKGSSFKVFYESVKFFNFIKKEHLFIDKIIDANDIDIIISDNRYGLWSKKVTSIIITHQLYVKTPFASKIVYQKIAQLIANFDECWIPDVEGTPNLSGDLAHLKPFKHQHQFIGLLSRFSELYPEGSRRAQFDEERENISRSKSIKKYDVLTILSGPEPQRTIFEGTILQQLSENNLKALLVRGLPTSSPKLKTQNSKLEIFNHLPSEELLRYFQKSNVIICRSGYSSVMDLVALGKRAILVPTPGQTEQEYLASYHLEQGNFYTQKQSEFDLEEGLSKVEKYLPKMLFEDKLTLDFLIKSDDFV